MPRANTRRSYGSVARTLHWLTALLILTAIPLGLMANQAAYDTSEALASKAQLFSVHKTVGIAAFTVALLRILWAIRQPRPAGLHPERRAETLLADIVHWTLYISLVAVPLTGWIAHSAVTGFAPILWPFGQALPFVPQSQTVALLAGSAHWVFTKLLVGSILLHVAGALKHHLIDRDATLRRMITGTEAGPASAASRHSPTPAMAALVIYAAGAGLALALTAQPETAGQTAAVQPPAATEDVSGRAPDGNWIVTDGTLGFSVQQMGAAVEGRFATWTATITFDETATNGSHGRVDVAIDTGSLTLGSVTDQAKAPDFLDTAANPQARFSATILPDAAGYLAKGTLSLRGVTRDISLPFDLDLDGDVAKMTGTTRLDRRDFGIGASYSDEATIGFTTLVTVTLTAKRAP